MSTFKKISLTVNAETGSFIDPVDGSKLNTASLPDFCLGETSILCLSFVDSSLNAYVFESDDSFELALDKDFVHTVSGVEDPLMAYSNDSMFNISGDWDSASLAAGKISVRINCNTTGFVSKIASSESVMAWIEIKKYPSGLSDASIILRNKCITRNSVKVTEGSPSTASPDYYTALQIDALIAEAESRVLTTDNTTEYTPTANYHPATKKYVDDNAGSGGTANPAICQGRLTLTSATPVTTSNVTAATTLYFTPYNGNLIGIYDGSSSWSVGTFSQLSLDISGLTASTNYDIFIYDNTGTLTLSATAWSSDTARATALTTQNGIYVKSGATNYRYIGTIRITSTTGQCEDSETKRFVWNYYNQVDKTIHKEDTTMHTYGTATLRYWNANSTHAVSFVAGESRGFSLGLSSTLKNYALTYLRVNGADHKMAGVEAAAYGIGGSSVSLYSSAGLNTAYVMELGNTSSAYFVDYRLNSTIKM